MNGLQYRQRSPLVLGVRGRSPFDHQFTNAKPYTARKRFQLQITCERHFKRVSLHSRGISQPSDIIQHCLVHLRSPDRFDSELLRYLKPATTSSNDNHRNDDQPQLSDTDLGTDVEYFNYSNTLSHITETGPLAQWASILDIGARRVLPGHLLRRSRVLASLQFSPTQFQQRVAITACTGEESVFNWSLQYHLSEESSSWVVTCVERDPSSDVPLPTTPHPKASPESVIQAQLVALKNADVFEAASFNLWSAMDQPIAQPPTNEEGLISDGRDETQQGPSLSPPPPPPAAAVGPQPTFSLGLNYERMRQFLQKPRYNCLLEHDHAILGAGALPTQRTQLQEVLIRTPQGTEHLFLWKLGMQANGCWMVTGIQPLDD